jgi:hypothetical protein
MNDEIGNDLERNGGGLIDEPFIHPVITKAEF